MPVFRAYCLDTNNRIISGEDIEASELSGAIQVVRSRCKKHPEAHPDRIEVWLGTSRVYPSNGSRDHKQAAPSLERLE
jgi:hypothetical protein